MVVFRDGFFDVTENCPDMVRKVFVGWVSREDIAYQVCKFSINDRDTGNHEVMPLKLHELREQGIIWRENDPKASTEVTFTRFLIPHLMNYNGWGVFCDCDFLFQADIRDLFRLLDRQYAVQVVKHDYTPKESVKMDGQVQEAYPRKNWSSLILFNCDHISNRVLDLEMINTKDPGFLHRFSWLKDEEIGKLPFHWNYLEGWYKSDDARAVHYTRGGPWFPDWQHVDYAEEWFAEFEAYSRSIEKSQETK